MYIITKDYICEGESEGDLGPDGISNADVELLKIVADGKAPKGTEAEHFHMYDGDGIRYYSGYYIATDDSDEFEALDCYGVGSGCTEIRIRNKEGKYAVV